MAGEQDALPRNCGERGRATARGDAGASCRDILARDIRDVRSIVGPSYDAGIRSGLDYYYEHSPRAAQQVSFRSHIAAARETGLPLIVHARDADDDLPLIQRVPAPEVPV